MGHWRNCYMIGFQRGWESKHLQFVGFVVEVWFLVDFLISYLVGEENLYVEPDFEKRHIFFYYTWSDRWSSSLKVKFKDHNSREMMKISRDFEATLTTGHCGQIGCLVYTLKFYWVMLCYVMLGEERSHLCGSLEIMLCSKGVRLLLENLSMSIQNIALC